MKYAAAEQPFNAVAPESQLPDNSGVIISASATRFPRSGLVQCAFSGAPDKAHSRRKFFDALKLNPDDRVAARIVGQMNDLFAIDAEARAQNLDHAARQVLRTERARPLLDQIRRQVEAARASALPASALGKAAKYTLTLWSKLTQFLDHPELELSNNLAENSMRPLVLGRKNWIHIGSQQAGPKIAAILSVVETCRRLMLPLRDYLASILPGLADLPVQQVRQLTPAAWSASR